MNSTFVETNILLALLDGEEDKAIKLINELSRGERQLLANTALWLYRLSTGISTGSVKVSGRYPIETQ